MSLRTLACGCLSFIFLATAAVAAEREVVRKSFVGQVPPQLVGSRDHWLGKLPPANLAALKGHVVWLQFNF